MAPWLEQSTRMARCSAEPGSAGLTRVEALVMKELAMQCSAQRFEPKQSGAEQRKKGQSEAAQGGAIANE